MRHIPTCPSRDTVDETPCLDARLKHEGRMGPPLESSAVANASMADGAPPRDEEKVQPLPKRHRKTNDGDTKTSSHTDSDDYDGRDDVTAFDHAQSSSEHEGSVPAASGVAPAASAEDTEQDAEEQDRNGGDMPVMDDAVEDNDGVATDSFPHAIGGECHGSLVWYRDVIVVMLRW